MDEPPTTVSVVARASRASAFFILPPFFLPVFCCASLASAVLWRKADVACVGLVARALAFKACLYV